MISVSVKWKTDSPAVAAKQAVRMTLWCKDRGLEYPKDYNWRMDYTNEKFIFSFKDNSVSSLFMLKWA